MVSVEVSLQMVALPDGMDRSQVSVGNVADVDHLTLYLITHWTIPRIRIDAFPSPQSLRPVVWLLLSTACAALAGWALEVAWNRVRLLRTLRKLRTQAGA